MATKHNRKHKVLDNSSSYTNPQYYTKDQSHKHNSIIHIKCKIIQYTKSTYAYL